MGLGLSASTIKSWFQYRCERKTRYELMTPDERAVVPIGDDGRERSWAVLGIDFEKRVVDRLGRTGRVLRPAPNEDALNDALLTTFLRGEGSMDHAARVNLRPRRSTPLVGGIEGMALRRTFADLVRREAVDGVLRFTVIDIKATRSPHVFHKAQVAFYALLLRAVL